MLFGVLELKNFLMSENSGKEYFVQQIQIGSDAASCNATNGTPLYPLKSDIPWQVEILLANQECFLLCPLVNRVSKNNLMGVECRD